MNTDLDKFTKEIERQRKLTKNFLFAMLACLLIGVPLMVLIDVFSHSPWGTLAIIPYFVELGLYTWRTR